MKQVLTILLGLLIYQTQAQNTYIDQRDNTHLCGPVEIEEFYKQPYAEWFLKSYEIEFDNIKNQKWSKKLKGAQVDIYLGTWCGDSRRLVPQFIKLWDDLGLDRDQLNIIALYNTKDKYKQGPNNEEEGAKIFRVPTFIFREDNQEIGRIVEFPATDLMTDVGQIALGMPSMPNYGGANYVLDLFEEESLEEINTNLNQHYRNIYKRVSRSNELNSLGYLLFGRDEVEKALVVFKLNTLLFRDDANTYDSYAEALMKVEDYAESLKNYEKALEMDPKNENAIAQIEILKEKLGSQG